MQKIFQYNVHVILAGMYIKKKVYLKGGYAHFTMHIFHF